MSKTYDDIRREFDYNQQLAILNSLKQSRVLHRPTQPLPPQSYIPISDFNIQPPPIPPRPIIPNATRLLIVTEQRRVRNNRRLHRNQDENNHRFVNPDEYKNVLEQTLSRSMIEYKAPFKGLSEKEKSVITRLTSHANNQVISAKKECTICMEAFQLGEARTIIPCTHDFHAKCINKWFETNNTCPICRTNISEKIKPYFNYNH